MPSSVVSHEVFRLLLNLEIEKARRLQYCVSIVCLMPRGAKRSGDPGLARRAADAVRLEFRTTDVVSPAHSDRVYMLLVDAQTRDLPLIFDRSMTRIRARGPGLPATAWSGGGGCYPLTASTADALLLQASALSNLARFESTESLRLPPG